MAIASFDPSRVIAVVGPTGSGKSNLALLLGKALNGELVCMDSMQLYRQLQIGTARPSQEELDLLPHHLFGSVDLESPITSLAYRTKAAEVLADIQARGKVPILVGGTGLYLRALFEDLTGLPETPAALRARLKARLERHGLARMYALLQRLDPRAASQLHGNDAQRIQRFLEVRLLTGESMVDVWARQGKDCSPKPLTLGLEVPREHLWNLLQQRANSWLRSGWIEETRSLIEGELLDRVLEVGPIGYREIALYLEGSLTFEQLLERIFFATRQYAKRQMTWFRKVSYIEWFPFQADSGYNMERISGFIERQWGIRAILRFD